VALRANNFKQGEGHVERLRERTIAFDGIDWNKTCELMANIVIYIYSEVFAT